NQTGYAPGATVQLTATPATGYHFTGWSGDTTSASNPITLTMSSDKHVTANFVINTYPLNVTIVGSGTVAKSPDQPTYNHGTSVQLTATPAVGYHFVSWSGDTSTASNPITLVMTGTRNVTATFAINTYTLTISIVGGGTVTKNPDQATYNHGTSVQLTATPGVGYLFVSWSGDTLATTNP